MQVRRAADVSIVCRAIEIFIFLVYARVILSWFPANPYGAFGQISRIIHQITDPVLLPVRRALPLVGPLDLSPIVVVIGLWFLQRVICR
ncbi:MAG: YggT family protein [Actinomycetes bacterium]